MKTTFKSLFWAGFFLVSMTQCQLCTKCVDITFPPEVDLYFNFKEGSYWVYKNSVNNALDSMYVSYFNKYDGGIRACVEASIDQVIKSQSTAINVYMSSKDMNLVGNDFMANKVNFNQTTTQVILNKRYDNLITAENCCLSNNCEASKYTERCKFLNAAQLTIRKLIFAPNIGLVKWETEKHPVYGKATFELVRYKIVKP